MSDRVTITMSDGTAREVHPDTPVRWAGGYAPLLAKYVKAGQTCDAVYEPTREHWTPYEPWMRDVLAGDARVSWIDGNECRCDWGWMRDEEDGDLAYMRLRAHPDDVPERPTEDDPDEDPDDALMAALNQEIVRQSRSGEVEIEVHNGYGLEAGLARAAREHIAQEPDEALWEEWERLCRNAEAERDEALAEAEGRIADLECRAKRAESDLADMTGERDEWKARHEALREDVGAHRDAWRQRYTGVGDTYRWSSFVIARAAEDFGDILDRDSERGGQA